MVSTLGEAHDFGWTAAAYCRAGRHPDGRMKAIPECSARVELDMQSLLWTRGREFPLAMLGSRLKCPRCGSRTVFVDFRPPRSAPSMRVVGI